MIAKIQHEVNKLIDACFIHEVKVSHTDRKRCFYEEK